MLALFILKMMKMEDNLLIVSTNKEKVQLFFFLLSNTQFFSRYNFVGLLFRYHFVIMFMFEV
jgi:hypothetical protein